MNRRDFGRLAGAAAVGQAVGIAAKAEVADAGVKLSVMLWTLEKLAPFDRCLEIVAAAGYQGVELVGEFQKWTPEETRQKLVRMKALGMRVDSMSGVKAGFAVPEERESFFAQFAAHLEAAQRLGCPQVILLSGKRVAGMTEEAQFAASVETLKRAGAMAAEKQIEIVIEPIDPLENPTIYLQTVTVGFAMVREVGSDALKVLYDFYHEQRAYGNLIEKLEGNIDKVGLVHVADVPGRHEPGSGEIDYANIYKKLAELKYDRYVAMEFYPQGDPVAALRKAAGEVRAAFRG
ncbi:TIM barrel protein [Granulicella sp. 5B5]|uniref:TIM barrel protein n=1 Tax=Granulicella sp. 5B5 TaxID=1617967 RepID=UPI0015F3B062|nr:TIM barrel protein [Granulicella sp. 5B5]QMV19537.1 TIM barrel protein [Granulicella sp. 5B5]